MPSGRTHDRITLWSLPVVTGATLALTRRSDLTLIVSGGFLFSGLMFSPDLDLHSRPFKRWGWLRWIWLPYQKAMRHRSVFSHGFAIGTLVRVLYLTVWIVGLVLLSVVVVEFFQDVSWSWRRLADDVAQTFIRYRVEWFAAFVGLELGAMSHSLSDWSGSAYKRWKRKQQKPNRRRSKRRTTKSRRTRK